MRLIFGALRQWNDNADLRWGAGLAYYALFSIAPLLVIAIHIAGFFFGAEAARGELQQQVGRWVGKEPAQAIEMLLQSAERSPGGVWATVVSYGLLFVGAVSVFLHLRAAFFAIWKLEPITRNNSILTIVIDYALALAMVLCVGLVLLASLVAGVVIATLRAYLGDDLPGGGLVWQGAEVAASVTLLTLLFAATFRVLSDARISWRDVWYGSAVAALLFTVGKVLFSFYIAFTGTASAYGAAGSVVVFLLWVYYSSQVLFFGAELIQARRIQSHEALVAQGAQAKI